MKAILTLLLTAAGTVLAVSTGDVAEAPRQIPRRDIFVGKDTPTINSAIKLAQPGDTIHLAPKVYRDYAGFYGKHGEPGLPITLDGHGATLEGSDPIDPAAWKEVAPGLFANDALMPRLDDAIIGRWFFLWNGRMNHMGRTSKGRSAPLKELAQLQPDEWTFIRSAPHADAKLPEVFGTFYIKLAPGKTLADMTISYPARSSGVQFSGDNSHLIIKNVTATHPYNDGFNIHGDCRNVVFENIRAIECGDDGISAHETAEYRVNGLTSIGNSTGITDTVAARTSYNNVFIADCKGFDLYFLNNGRYKLTNAVILSSAQNPFTVTGGESEQCDVTLEKVLFRRIGLPASAMIAKTASLRATRLTTEGIDFDLRGESHFDNCLLNGKPAPAGSTATGAPRAELLQALVPAAFLSAFANP